MFSKKEIAILKIAFDEYVKEYCASLPTKEELQHITFSPEFEEKMQKLIEAEKKFYYYWFNTVGKRVATVIAALLIAATTATFSIKALREPFLRFIVETFEKFTSITMVDDEPPSSDDMILQKVEPTYIPEGYTIESRNEGAKVFKIVYISEDKLSDILYNQTFDDGSVMQVDTEETEYEPIKIHDYNGVVYDNKGKNALMFSDGTYVYNLVSVISEDELIKMAESIVEK